MWNDTDTPLAFLITFRSHGTWLHGDERGSVNRFRNQYKSTRLPAEKKWLETNTKRLRDEPVILDADQRGCVKAAANQTCKFRKWHLSRNQCANESCSRGGFDRRQETGTRFKRIQGERHTYNERDGLLESPL